MSRLSIVVLLFLSACAPTAGEFAARTQAPALGEFFVAGDGAKLDYRVWLPGGSPAPKAVVVALHGFNDYSRAFDVAARTWAAQGIATYAYDQRGFGGNHPRGLWPGSAAMVADLKDFTVAVRARHPGVPLYLFGSSMGGAVVIAALGGPDPPRVAGTIVAAPAALGRESLPPAYTAALWLAAHTVPWFVASGRDLKRVPSDNIPMLRALFADVRVIKGARIDVIYGLVGLMDLALERAPNIRGPLLYLYGERDDIIRPGPTRALIARIPKPARRVALYQDGYHMLLRDLQASVVHEDVAAWVRDPAAPLPSGADRRELSRLDRDE